MKKNYLRGLLALTISVGLAFSGMPVTGTVSAYADVREMEQTADQGKSADAGDSQDVSLQDAAESDQSGTAPDSVAKQQEQTGDKQNREDESVEKAQGDTGAAGAQGSGQETDQENELEIESSESVEEQPSEAVQPAFSITDTEKTEKVFTMKYQNYSMPANGKQLEVAVWSDVGGQDDLKWYPLSLVQNGNSKYYQVQVKTEDHKSPGNYNVHLYLKTTTNQMICLEKSSFRVSEVTCDSMEILKDSKDSSRAQVILKGVTVPSGVKKVEIPVWSKSDQSDIYWYQASRQADGSWVANLDLVNHKGSSGTFQVHAYASSQIGFRTFLRNDTVELKEMQTSGSTKLSVTDTSHDQKLFTILYSKYAMPSDGSRLEAAVWSDVGGQDDLKWYILTDTGLTGKQKNYRTEVKTPDHKSSGTYNLHLYLKKKDGKMVCLEKTTFTVDPVTCGEMEILQDPDNKSTAKVILHDVEAPSGVTSVELPVWSKSDQKDIYWYKAVKKTNGTWEAELNVSRHSGSRGSFQVHVYGTNGVGARNFLCKSTVELTASAQSPVVNAAAVNNGLKLSLKNCTETDVKNITFAVWSKANGQDDLKWYTVATATNGAYELVIPPLPEQGLYYIHCYCNTNAGSMVLQGTMDYTVERASAQAIIQLDEERTDGRFSLLIQGVVHGEQIKEIRVPVWSASDQSDMVWYKAERKSDGSYQVNSDISKHKNHTGTYQAHVYITDNGGTQYFTCKTSFTVKEPKQEVHAQLSEDYASVKLSATGLLSTDIKEVHFAVWSDKNGQDDLKWYTATKNGAEYSVTVPSKNHPDSGKVNAHAYLIKNNGSMTFLKSTSYEMDWTINGELFANEFSEKRFSSDVEIRLEGNTDAVTKVEIAAWSAKDQSDLHWYTAARSGDQLWMTELNPAFHKNNMGTYILHAYVTFANGQRIYVGSANCRVSTTEELLFRQNADGTVTAIYYPASEKKSVSLAVWSDTNGQDDLKWYTMTKADGAFTAVVSVVNHKHTGEFHAHLYADSACLARKTFSFPESIGSTTSVSTFQKLGHSDAKFFRNKVLAINENKRLVLLNTQGTLEKTYNSIQASWFSVYEAERLIVYSNGLNQLGLAKLDSSNNLSWNRILFTFDRQTIDPTITKTASGYMITATKVTGIVNNSDPAYANGTYQVCVWTSDNLTAWTEEEEAFQDATNIEDIDVLEDNGLLYMVYEKETIDRGKSSIEARISRDGGKTWEAPVQLLASDCDHEPAVFSKNGDRFILFYSADKDNPGSSYMGAKAYYAVYDENLRCITKDVEVKTGAKGGVLWYDVTWVDATHYILYAENYMTAGTLVIEKSRS